MNKEETLSNLKAYLDGDTAIGNIIPLRTVLESAIKYLSKSSLPSELDEAANNYGVDIRLGYPRVMDETDRYIYNAFKAGAEWMAGQGETVEGDVEGNWRNQEDAPYEIYVTSDCLPQDTEFKAGDEVVVQIRKK